MAQRHSFLCPSKDIGMGVVQWPCTHPWPLNIFLFDFFSSCHNIITWYSKLYFNLYEYISIIIIHNCSMNRGKVASIKSLLTPLDQSQVWQFMATWDITPILVIQWMRDWIWNLIFLFAWRGPLGFLLSWVLSHEAFHIVWFSMTTC